MAATQVTRDQTVALATAPGQRLRADAAAAWDAAVRAFGSTVLLTDSHRPYDTQERIFRERYVQGDHRGRSGYTSDVRYWQGVPWTRRAGTAAAAVPGTSNHGGGLAVDVKTKRSTGDPAHPAAVVFTGFSDADRLRFLEVARPYGWADDEGRSVSEHWHLTYYPARDTRKTPTPTPTPAPAPARATDDEEILIMAGYPHMLRGNDNDVWTVVLSPSKRYDVSLPPAGDERTKIRKGLVTLYGEPQTIGDENAKRARTTIG